MTPDSVTLTVGESKTLSAFVFGPNAKTKWKSSKKSVAKVDKRGKVTAVKAGKATITVTANGKSAKCKVTVVKKSAALDQIDLTKYLNMDIDKGLKKLKSDCGSNSKLYQKAVVCLNYGSSKINKVGIDKTYSVDGIANGDKTVTVAGFYKGMPLSEINAVITSGGWKKYKTQSLGGSLLAYYTNETYRVRLYVMSSGTLLQVIATTNSNASLIEY